MRARQAKCMKWLFTAHRAAVVLFHILYTKPTIYISSLPSTRVNHSIACELVWEYRITHAIWLMATKYCVDITIRATRRKENAIIAPVWMRMAVCSLTLLGSSRLAFESMRFYCCLSLYRRSDFVFAIRICIMCMELARSNMRLA